MAHAIARVLELPIAGIFPPGLADGLQVSGDLTPRDGQQWTNDAACALLRLPLLRLHFRRDVACYVSACYVCFCWRSCLPDAGVEDADIPQPRMNVTQPAGSGPAHEAHEHGLCLVVLGVGGGNFVEREASAGARSEVVDPCINKFLIAPLAAHGGSPGLEDARCLRIGGSHGRVAILKRDRRSGSRKMIANDGFHLCPCPCCLIVVESAHAI